jgi:hypothetical protein
LASAVVLADRGRLKIAFHRDLLDEIAEVHNRADRFRLGVKDR